jgi:hypothetical protein
MSLLETSCISSFESESISEASLPEGSPEKEKLCPVDPTMEENRKLKKHGQHLGTSSACSH